MTLRRKTVAIIGASLVVLVLSLYFLTRWIVEGGFEKVERDLFAGFSKIEQTDTVRHVQRVEDALQYRIQALAYKAADWAQWTDTYEYIKDRNRAYYQSNLTDEALEPLAIDLFLLLDTGGRPVFTKALNREEGASVPVPDSVWEHVLPGKPLLRHPAVDTVVSGLVLLPEGPMMVVSRPVLTSEGEGPPRGTLVFGRYLDDGEFAELAKVTHLAVSRQRGDAGELPEDYRAAAASLKASPGVAVRILGPDKIAGFAAVRDLYGKTALYLRVDLPREVHAQARVTQADIRDRGGVILASLVGSICFAGLVLGGAMLALLESSVLARLTRLSCGATEIGRSGDFSGRVEAAGSDEIASLADALNGMLGDLAATHRQIDARNAEMRLLMGAVPVGLLSLDEDFRVNPEHSRSAAEILGARELAGREFPEVLGLTGEREPGAANLREFLDVLRQELVPEDVVADLNPFEELQLGADGDQGRWVRLRYFNIRRGEGKANHVLVVVEDISQEKRLAAEVTQQERENTRLRAIAEDPDLFRDFLVETREILRHVAALSGRLGGAGGGREAVDEVFRGVHTIKGVAGSFGLAELGELAATLEASLEPLRAAGEISAEQIEDTRAGVARLEAAFDEVVASARRLLGDDFSLEGGLSLRIPLDELKRQIAEIQGMAIEESLKDTMVGRIKGEMLRRLRALRAVPARKGLARSVKIVPGLAARLGKDVEFRFEGQDTPVDCEVASELNTPLIHLLRNAFDHGVESAEERCAVGKDDRGLVSLEVSRQNGHLLLAVADDGKGLDPERLRAAAVTKGLLQVPQAEGLGPQECLDLIFLPGFSTAREVTDVSGRGVGMDAVLDSVRRKLGGEIRVSSTPGRGTRFSIVVPVAPEGA